MVLIASLTRIRLNPSTWPQCPHRAMKTPAVKLEPFARFFVHRSPLSDSGVEGEYGSIRRMILRVNISPV